MIYLLNTGSRERRVLTFYYATTKLKTVITMRLLSLVILIQTNGTYRALLELPEQERAFELSGMATRRKKGRIAVLLNKAMLE